MKTKSPDAKLTLDRKRAIALQWFTDPTRIRIRDLPAARPFVRRAAADLGLSDLRKLRNAKEIEGLGTGDIDEIACDRIMGYRPRKDDVDVGPGKAEKAAATAPLDDETVKTLLLAFYDDADKIPLGRFLRNHNAFRGKNDVLEIVKSVQLRRMRRMGEDRSVVVRKIDAALADKNGKAASVETCAAALASMEIDGQEGHQQQQKKNEGEDATISDDAQKIKKMQRKVQQRRAARMAERKGVVAATRQQRRAEAILNVDASVLRPLVIEWFDHPSKPSIVDFLKSKDLEGDVDAALDAYKRPMRLVCKAGQLLKLRKTRETDPTVRVRAMEVIDTLFGAGGAAKIADAVSIRKNGKAKVAIKEQGFGMAVVDASSEVKNKTVDAAPPNKETMRKIITEWYVDKEMRPVRKFLKEEGYRNEVAPVAAVVGMIKSKSLVKLRKARDDPDVAALAKVRIEQLFDDVKVDEEGSANATNNAKRPGKVGKVRLQKKDLSESQRERLKTYLVEWFHAEDVASIPDFLEAKGHPELRPAMAKLATELGLCRLRKERRALGMTASRRIDGAFGKKKVPPGPCGMANGAITKKKKAVPAHVTPSPPADLVEDDGYVSVADTEAVAQDDAPPPTYDAVAAANKDLDFVLIQ